MTEKPDATLATTSLVKNYVAVRDRIKAIGERHSEELKPFTDLLTELSGKLQEVLDTTNAESIKTSAGTVYQSSRYSASLSDPKAFMDFVVKENKFELLDRKANAAACRDFAAETGAQPPGVNLSGVRTIGVRRA